MIIVGDGIYFYCIDCAEKYRLAGEIKDLRNKGNKQVQCFSCNKIISIYIEDSRKLRSSGNTIFGRQLDGTWVEPNANDSITIEGDGVADWWLDLKKTYGFNTISTRPVCPVCGKAALTGELSKANSEKGSLFTICENPFCISTIYLDNDWKIVDFVDGAEYCEFGDV